MSNDGVSNHRQNYGGFQGAVKHANSAIFSAHQDDKQKKMLELRKRLSAEMLDIVESKSIEELTSKTVMDNAIDQMYKSSKNQNVTRCTMERVYQDILMELAVKDMIDNAEKSGEMSVKDLKECVKFKTGGCKEKLMQIRSSIEKIMKEFNISPSGLRRRVNEIIVSVINNKLQLGEMPKEQTRQAKISYESDR